MGLKFQGKSDWFMPFALKCLFAFIIKSDDNFLSFIFIFFFLIFVFDRVIKKQTKKKTRCCSCIALQEASS